MMVVAEALEAGHNRCHLETIVVAEALEAAHNQYAFETMLYLAHTGQSLLAPILRPAGFQARKTQPHHKHFACTTEN